MAAMTASPLIAVLGAGGIGGLLAAVLARDGNRVVMLASESASRAIAERGIRIESQRFGDFEVRLPSATRLDTPVDACLIAVKSMHLKDALERVPSAALADGLIVPFLNGIDHVDLLREVYRSDSVATATIRTELAKVATGVIRQASPFASIEIAVPDAARDRVERLAHRLTAAGFDVRIRTDETTVLWDKLSFLAPLALMTTHKHANAGAIRTRWRAETLAVITEVVAVAAAEGAAVDPAVVTRFLELGARRYGVVDAA